MAAVGHIVVDHVGTELLVSTLLPDGSQLPNPLPDILTGLTSKSHLERDRAVRRFEDVLPTCNATQLSQVKLILLSRLSIENEWHLIHAGTLAVRIILSHERESNTDTTFISSLQAAAGELVCHAEARVREVASQLIGDLALTNGESTWNVLQPVLLTRADQNFALDERQRVTEAARIAARDVDDAAGCAKQARNLIHETEGWRGLETTLLALAALTRGCGSQTMDALADPLRCAERARHHPNRFVREAGLRLVDAAAVAAIATKDVQTVSEVARIALPSLRAGLQDNWSQVRFAASVATRTALTPLPHSDRESLYSDLLPRMCLNRHYVAEGVRNYSHETWRVLFGGGATGRQWLCRLLPKVIAFFESQTRADNHAVREAACQSLGEIAVRLDCNSVRPFAGQIAQALVDGFKDESWPVRDHACGALTDVICAFPDDVEVGSSLWDVHTLFVRHLSDNIASVRVNCANCFVKACMAYSDDHPVMGLPSVKGVVREHLSEIRSQREDLIPGEIEDNTRSRTSDTQFGASTKLAGAHMRRSDGHDDAHTNQTMYSCGSLAPKLRRGGGCSDHGFVRPREMWEVTEGGILVWQALLNSGKRGHAVAMELFADMTSAGARGAQKRFRQRAKFMVGVLKAIVLGVQAGAVMLDDDVARDVAKCVVVAAGDRADASRAAASECRRIMARTMGLRKFAELETEAAQNISTA